MFLFYLTSALETTSVSESERLDALLFETAKGDAAAFEALYRAARTPVYSYALSILKQPYDAEDVLQDCFLHILASAANYRSQGKPMAWILTIARNLCFEKVRVGLKTTALSETDWWNAVQFSDADTSSEDRVLLEACFSVLHDTERQIVVLHAVAGFKHREIAQYLDLALPTVLSKYNRALKKLKTELEKERVAL